MDKQNLFIFVADSLRYDYLPETVAAEGTVIPTLAPSPRSPSSFASLVTGKAVRSHAVRSFHDTLSPSHTTLFDRFEEGSYYDHEDDPVRKTVLQHAPPTKELAELDQGFVFFERAMESHFPYNEIPHGNPLKHQDMDAGELSQYSRRELRQRYQEGVDGVADHFWDHVQELEDRGLRENTLIVFTSDH
ncbi:MAG: hypothetical protein SVW77_01805, partial [Candidatus Nanohaloarchaea archaeon]|nr:hypothetical protein [Candidatus Nanohaloarchaea archaeon]